jgi:hypothetical protein
MPVLLKSPGGWDGMSEAVLEVAYDVVIDGKGQATGPGSSVNLSVKCRSCPVERTFSAPDDRLLARQVASSGWNIDGGVAECPRCYLDYQGSVMRAAGGTI